GTPAERARRALRLPRGDWGKTIAHAGFGVTIFGIAALTAWQQEDIRVAQVGERFEVGQFGVSLDNVEKLRGPNYEATRGTMSVWKGDRKLYELFPEKRFYPVAGMPTTEAAIHNGILRDMYLVIGDPQDNGGWAVRTYVKPFANWIWVGAIIMAFGGLMSLSDRRYRVAAGARKAAPSGAVPAE
ncbi:MAG: cytochrome c-type biogenesis CcmF C-terminal domain-containing protein, partial [Paracoccaceae bacterium]